MQNKRDGLVHIAMNYYRTKRKSCYDCRWLVTHCSAAIIHSKGFITKLLLVNTLITQYHSHARIVTQLLATYTQARHARDMDNNVDKESNNYAFHYLRDTKD